MSHIYNGDNNTYFVRLQWVDICQVSSSVSRVKDFCLFFFPLSPFKWHQIKIAIKSNHIAVHASSPQNVTKKLMPKIYCLEKLSHLFYNKITIFKLAELYHIINQRNKLRLKTKCLAIFDCSGHFKLFKVKQIYTDKSKY